MYPLLHQGKKVDIQSVNKVPIYTRTKKVSLIRLILVGLVLHCIQNANQCAVYDRIKRKVNIDSVLQVIRKGTHWSALYVNQNILLYSSLRIGIYPRVPVATKYDTISGFNVGFPKNYAKITQAPQALSHLSIPQALGNDLNHLPKDTQFHCCLS